MRERSLVGFSAVAMALAAAVAAKPSQLVPLVYTSRHRNSQYDKEAARSRRRLDRAVRHVGESDIAAITAAEAKRQRRAAKLLAQGSL